MDVFDGSCLWLVFPGWVLCRASELKAFLTKTKRYEKNISIFGKLSILRGITGVKLLYE